MKRSMTSPLDAGGMGCVGSGRRVLRSSSFDSQFEATNMGYNSFSCAIRNTAVYSSAKYLVSSGSEEAPERIKSPMRRKAWQVCRILISILGHKLCQCCQHLPIYRLVAAAMRRAQEAETKDRISLMVWYRGPRRACRRAYDYG